MATVIYRGGPSVRGIKKITVVRKATPGGRGQSRVLFQGRSDDGESDSLLENEMRVRIVRPGSGVFRDAEIDRSGLRRKKQSKPLRPVERAVRKLVQREFGIAQVYLARHRRSNRRKKNGWLWDLGRNVRRAIKDSV